MKEIQKKTDKRNDIYKGILISQKKFENYKILQQGASNLYKNEKFDVKINS